MELSLALALRLDRLRKLENFPGRFLISAVIIDGGGTARGLAGGVNS
jgi:hypothetical protein